MRHLYHLFGARGIHGPAASCQPFCNIAQEPLPFIRGYVGRSEHGEFTAQQDKTKKVPEDDALLLDQVARLNELVEVAAESKQLRGTPDRLRLQIGQVGIKSIEIEPQLVR